MKKVLMIIAFAAGAVCQLKAQIDPHFSQYYAYPLYLNPALTGVINGDLRVNGNFKDQYATINDAYKTGALSVDYRPTDKVGLGFNMLNQAAGTAGYNYFSAYGSLGYAITVSNDGFKKVSFGIQAGIINRSFNPSEAQFGSQYNPQSGYDPTLPSGENFLNSASTVFDAGAGIFYYDGNPLHSANLFGGISAAHLSRPNDPFAVTGSNTKLPVRYIVHGGVRVKVSDYFDLIPHAIFIKQQFAQEKGAGAYSELKLNDNKGLILGGMYRFQDAAIVNVGYHVDNLIMGLSYDFNTSALDQATGGQGGLELSMSYVFHKRIEEPEPICPRL
jgi:type IX secretion system PorP/SprF family membrane protein